MHVWDAELLTTKKPAELVTDGLFMWFDGRDAPTTSKKLHERITNTDYDYMSQGGSFSGFTQHAGLYTKIQTGSSSVYGCVAFNGSSAKTYEFVTSSLTGYCYGMDNQVTGGAIGGTLYISSTNRVDTRYADDLSKAFKCYVGEYPNHIIIRKDSVVINGVKYAAQNMLYTAFQVALRVNTWSENTEYIGAIRAYNRELTDAEVLRNLRYEKSIGRA